MSDNHEGQYLIVYGPPKGTPTVYATAYRVTEREAGVRACMKRYPETPENAVRVVRSCDLDPSVAKGPTTL